MPRLSGVLLLALLGAAAAESPVQKVVLLLQDLKMKIEEDGKMEQKVYDKFACWCEKTTAAKAEAIEAAKTRVEELSKNVLTLKGKTSSYKASVAQLERDIAGNLDGQAEATSIRKKETEDYQSSRESLEAAIGALEHAIKVLEGAGEFTQKRADPLHEAELIGVAGALGGALGHAPVVAFASDADRNLINAFVHDPSEFFGGRARLSAVQVRGPFGDYAPGSTKIQGILKGMYDAMVADLESKNGEQGRKQKEYEELMSTKNEALEQLRTTLTTKKETLGEDTKELADSVKERDETQRQLTADTDFFMNAKEDCKNEADEWAERTRLRTEEKAGVTKAIEILQGGESTFASATSMLLQRRDGKDAKREALRRLRHLARDHHSIRLAKVASLVQTASAASFPMVMEAVDKMLAELRQEEMDDITLRDYCQNEEHKVEGEIEDMDHKIKQLDGSLERLRAKKKELQGDQLQTEADISATEDAMAEALSERNVQSEDFKAALKDDLDAVELLGKAIDALGGGAPGLLLIHKARKVRKLRAPAPEYDSSGAPPETFKEPYKGPRDMSAGITSIMGYIKEDLENEIILAKQAESKAQKEFEEQRSISTGVLLALKAKLTGLETQEAETDDKIGEDTESKEATLSMKQGKEDYRESLRPKCDWMKDAFDTRRKARQEEMTGLLHAKAALAGSGEGEEVLAQQGSFLSRRLS